MSFPLEKSYDLRTHLEILHLTNDVEIIKRLLAGSILKAQGEEE